MKLSLAVTIIALFFARAAYGQILLVPPPWPASDIKPNATHIQPVTGITLDAFHVTFEETTFNDVLDALGTAPIRHQGDAGAFLMWVCYTLPGVHARVWLTSSELGGQKYVNGMVAKQLESTDTENSLCPVAARQITVASIDRSIWLGDGVEKVKRLLGPGVKGPAPAIYYMHEGKVREFDVDSFLVLAIHNNKVEELYASHTTTD